MGLLPLPPSPPLSNTPDPGSEIIIQSQAGPSNSQQQPFQLNSSQDTVVTPPTSPLPLPLLGNRKRKRQRGSKFEDEESVYSITTSDGEFLPSPAASASTTTSSGTRILRGGGKRQQSTKSSKQGLPNSQHSSYSATTNTGRSKKNNPGGERGSGGSRRTTRSKAKRAFSPSDLITTSLEEIAIEEAAVKAEINRLGLMLRDVKGDGNCLFRVLSDQGFGGEKKHNEIRRLVCDYLETHKDVMEGFVVPFMKDGEGYEGYVTRMRQLKQFGSHIEIQAAARVFKRNIRVVMSTTSFTIPWQTEATTCREPPETPSPADVGPVPTTPSHRTRSKTIHTPHAPSILLPESLPSVQEDRSMLWLALFSQAEHFQSIRRMGDREHGPAEIEDRLSIPHARDVSEAARRERGELIDEIENKTPVPLSSKVSQVLSSLPPGHGVSSEQVEGILGRAHGDIGEAVEILLEHINQEKEGISDRSDSGSSDHVEQMLLSPNSIIAPTDPLSGRDAATPQDSGPTECVTQHRSDTSHSPSHTATTSTESRSHSRSRSNSDTSLQSASTSQTEAFDDSGNTTNLSMGIKDMKVDTQLPRPVDQAVISDDQKRGARSGVRGERRRSARLGTVGA